MKREFLKELGLEKDIVDKIMAEHGKTMNLNADELNNLKQENEALKKEQEENSKKLQEFISLNKDNNALADEVSKLKSDLEQTRLDSDANLKSLSRASGGDLI